MKRKKQEMDRDKKMIKIKIEIYQKYQKKIKKKKKKIKEIEKTGRSK